MFNCSICESLFLNNTPVAGNVILCFTALAERTPVEAVASVRKAGGVGVIIAKHPGDVLGPCRNDFPCIEVDYELGTKILYYIRSTRYYHSHNHQYHNSSFILKFLTVVVCGTKISYCKTESFYDTSGEACINQGCLLLI